MGVSQITARGAVRLDLASRGASEEAIIRGLNGKGSVKFTDGSIRGVDLNALGRIVQSVLTTEALTGVTGDNAKTAFGQMSASFTVQGGVLATNDLALTGSGVEVNGKGSADLSSHRLEFHFVPKAKRGLPGLNLVDIGVPFYVKGDWTHPSYGPEAGGLAKGLVHRLGDDAKLPLDVLTDPGGTLKSLFGGVSGK